MEISVETKDFVERLDSFSHHKLTHRDAFTMLIELGRHSNQQRRIEEIAFLSKFLSNTYGILKRSTSETEGYEKLTREFQENLNKVTDELKKLIELAPEDTKENFSSTFLTMSTQSFENLLDLLHDFSWLKNWYIEKKSTG